jgi:hypothetical protein
MLLERDLAVALPMVLLMIVVLMVLAVVALVGDAIEQRCANSAWARAQRKSRGRLTGKALGLVSSERPISRRNDDAGNGEGNALPSVRCSSKR